MISIDSLGGITHEKSETLPTGQYQIREYKHDYEVRFSSHRKRIHLLLRSFWGRDFALETLRGRRNPQLHNGQLCFPEALRCDDLSAGATLYRAMAMHMAAHLAFTLNWPHDGAGLSPAQRYLIELVEDARVEQGTIHHYPGIKKLWHGYMVAHDTRSSHPTAQLLGQIMQALLDKATPVDDTEVNAWVQRFQQVILFNRTNSAVSVQLGLELHDILSASNALEGIELHKLPPLSYRDQGRLLWGDA